MFFYIDDNYVMQVLFTSDYGYHIECRICFGIDGTGIVAFGYLGSDIN